MSVGEQVSTDSAQNFRNIKDQKAGYSWVWIAVLAAEQSIVVALSSLLQRSSAPILYADEMGYLAAAAELSTRSGEPFLGHTAPYAIGYSVLLAVPMSIIGADPWRIAVGLNIVAVVGLPILCFLMIKMLSSVSNSTAAAVAAAAGAYPATVLQVTRAWPEAVLPSLILIWAILALASTRRPRFIAYFSLAVVASLIFAVHHRTLAILGTTVALFIVSLVRGIRSRNRQKIQISAIGLATSIAATFVGATVESSVALKLHLSGNLDRGSQVLSGLHLSRLSFTSQVFVGQVWYLLAASLGLVWLCGVAMYRAIREHHSDRDWVLLVAVSMLGTLFIGSAAIGAGHGFRADTFIYGRYIEIFVPLIIVIALALHRDISPDNLSRRLRWSVLMVAPIAMLIIAFHGSDAFTANYQKVNLYGILAYEFVNGHLGSPVRSRLDLPVIAMSVIAAITVLMLVSRRGVRSVATATWLMFALMSFAVSSWTLHPWLNIFEQSSVDAALVVERAGEVGAVFDGPGGIRVESLNALLYRARYPRVEVVRGNECPTTDLVAAGDDWSPEYLHTPLVGLPPFGGTLFEVSCD